VDTNDTQRIFYQKVIMVVVIPFVVIALSYFYWNIAYGIIECIRKRRAQSVESIKKYEPEEEISDRGHALNNSGFTMIESARN
jgi:hypothetical protein